MQLPKNYEPSQYESDIYALWEKSGAFIPKHRGSKKSFAMVFPLPNANGNLHLGHGLTNAIYDVVTRYHRMKGEAALYLPGADHAGFETQVVYEKQLAKQGKSRFDFTRDELYSQVWDFVQLNKSNFESQFRRLGASCDWTRYVFTLDDKIVRRAYATFKQLWEDGLVYRGERLVNFCTYHGTGFADIEVAYKDVDSHLWYIKYPLTDGSGHIIVATTRPETMLGDTAVAVNPSDERYKAFHGRTITLPLTKREVPIIADEFVDVNFGTGAVKLTPAHDPNDYEAAQRHSLPMITVINHEGKLTHEMPEAYRGLTVDEARKLIVSDLEEQGVLEKQEKYSHSVGHCYKCGTVIQPLLREQWFIDMQPLAKEAIKALRDNKITFYPETKKQQLITYLKGLRDWNISRQIAWGIPIPAFQNVDDPEDWIFDERVGEETIQVNGKTYHRDPDVFDTWFSSSSWPYATLEYPDSDDFKSFYPTGLLDTGGEILYPWVSRMIMLGLYVTGEVPFKEVYIHGYVMAEDGSKMSKSLGNVVDPLPVIDQFGSDALRMGLLAGRSPAVNRGYDPRKVEEARNFCNKLWNIARFAEDKLAGEPVAEKPEPKTSGDEWVLYRLQQTIQSLGTLLDEYRFSEAYDTLYHFVWDDVADWYIEISKTHLNTSVLGYVLDNILRITHPFAPFVTETIWQTLHADQDSLVITSEWPETVKADKKAADDFQKIKDIVSEIRFIRGTLHLRSGFNLYHAGDLVIAKEADLLKALARLEAVKEVTDGKGLHLTSTTSRCWLDLDQESMQSFQYQLRTHKEEQEKLVAQFKARLANKSYVQNAPKAIVNQTREQLAEAEALLQKVTAEYDRFTAN